MSIDRDGFLSPDIVQSRDKYRARNPEAFQMITETNRLAQSVLPSFDTLLGTTKNLLACGYYIRALQNLQGAVLMAENGLMSEACTLVRSGLETVFYLGATVRAENIKRDLSRDHVKRVKAAMSFYRKVVPEGDRDIDLNELEAVLGSMLPEGVDPAKISIEAIAKQAELSDLYDGLYRQLSVGHAHPSLLSLSSIWDVDEDHETKGVLWGPERRDLEEIRDVLIQVYVVMYNLLTQWAHLASTHRSDTELHDRIEQLGLKYLPYVKTSAS
jgi:hypothetical protein